MKINFLALIFLLFPSLVISQEYSHIYTFNIADAASYSTSCGDIDNNEWTVSKNSCNFYTPEFIAWELKAYSERTIDINLKISNSGNLNEKDFAWVFYFIDDKPAGSRTIKGDVAEGFYKFTDSIMVPARSKYRIRIALVCDKADEYWKLADGDLVISQRAMEGEEIVEDKSVTGKIFTKQERGLVKLFWNAESNRNGNYFKIERSKNGNDFEFAGYVKEDHAAGKTTAYSFIDAGSTKTQTWYRVTQVDDGGNQNLYGKPVMVKIY